MGQFLVNHPAIILAVLPTVLAAVPGLLAKAEAWAIAALLKRGDAVDQAAIKGTIAVWVQWAEARYGDGTGKQKLAAVTAAMARLFPFVPRAEIEDLIEQSVRALDSGARDATK